MQKYILYAVGEIVLVVVGILIALQINNWNQQRQNKQTVDNLLRKIQVDIESDIKNSNQLLSHYAQVDSLIWMVLNDWVTTEDYEASPPFGPNLHNLVINYEQINFKKAGYENLMRMQDIIPKEYEQIVEKLSVLYNDVYDFVMVSENQFKEDVLKYIEWLYHEHDWFSNPVPPHLNQEKIEYHLNDIKYKGLVKMYRSKAIENYIMFCNGYRKLAVEVHLLIDSLFNEKRFADHLSQPLYADSTYAGNYRLINGDTLVYIVKDGRSFLRPPNQDSLITMENFAKNRMAIYRSFFRFENGKDGVNLYQSDFQGGREPVASRID